MCAVAARGLYRGMGPDELAGLGIGLSMFDMPALASLAARITAEEQAKRRPVAVAIVAEPTAVPVVADVEEPMGSAAVHVADPVAAHVAEAADVAGHASDVARHASDVAGHAADLVMVSEAGVEVVRPVVTVPEERAVERDFDVPIRLATAPAGA
jgi:predicted lipid-binding transport protein (Tim44 family)